MSVRVLLEARFLAKVEKTETCWLWTGFRRRGYGIFRLNERSLQAHRVAYELFVGPIPDGLQLDHLCRNRACVNPAHLEPVTGRENVMRSPIARCAANARKTHCPQNHPYDETNTYRYGDGRRECRICRGAREKARAA